MPFQAMNSQIGILERLFVKPFTGMNIHSTESFHKSHSAPPARTERPCLKYGVPLGWGATAKDILATYLIGVCKHI